MDLNAGSMIRFTWEGLGLVWVVGCVFTKRTVRSQSAGSRLFQLGLAGLGFALLGGRWFRDGWLGMRFLPAGREVEMAGLALTIAGALFAVWARATLGGNWSGRATVKEDHELMRRGPYALTRHPIYSGLLLAVVGTAVAEGEWRCVAAVAVILLAMMLKMTQEERLMMEAFPGEYPEYRRRVKALIPGVF